MKRFTVKRNLFTCKYIIRSLYAFRYNTENEINKI